MDTAVLINSLVETYKELNVRFRTQPANEAMIGIVTRMRTDEIQFSQALKDRVTGIGTAGGPEKEILEGSDTNFAQLISQFGSARATTLNLLKNIQSESVWDQILDDGSSIRIHVQDLVSSDRKQLENLQNAVRG